MEFLFLVLKSIAIISAIGVVSVRNPVHSVLALIIVFGSVAGIMLLLGAEFLAIVYLVVYVGAIAVLFLFVVMMLNVRIVELSSGAINYLPLGALLVMILGLLITTPLLQIFPEDFPTHVHKPINLLDPASNIMVLGQYLFTYEVVSFILGGLILLIAMLGAILLTLTHEQDVRRQDIFAQKARSLVDSVKNVR